MLWIFNFLDFIIPQNPLSNKSTSKKCLLFHNEGATPMSRLQKGGFIAFFA